MYQIDYIIPVCNIGGDDFYDRVENLNFILANFLSKQTGVHVHVILVEQLVKEKLPQFLESVLTPPCSDTFSYEWIVVSHPVFVKPWLYNIGVKHAKSNNIIVGESDVYSDADFLADFVKFVDTRSLKWCFMWRAVAKIPKQSKTLLLKSGVLDIYGSEYKTPRPKKCEGMGVLFKKDFWEKELHGANELFRKLGGNDNDLAQRARVLTGTYKRYPQLVIHLWHKTSSMKKNRARTLNYGMKMFLHDKEENSKIVTNFLASQDLGSLEKPMIVSIKVIKKFFISQSEEV